MLLWDIEPTAYKPAPLVLLDNAAPQDYTQLGLPQNAKRRLGKGRVTDMAYAPDGNQLTVSTQIGIWIYDARTGEELKTLIGGQTVFWIAYAPDGRTLVSCSVGVGSGDKIRVWDTTTGAYETPFTEEGFRYISGMALSPDGSTLATGDYEQVHLWDTVTGERKAALKTLANDIVIAMAFSPDGKTIATESDGGTIRLWDVATATHKATLQGHTNRVTSIAFSPDGRTLASSSKDKTIRLWDTTAAVQKATLTVPSMLYYSSYSIAFSPDGRTLATAVYKDVVLWDVPSRQVRRTLRGQTVIQHLAFSPDGRTLATESGEIQFWDVGSGEHKTTFVGDYTQAVTNVAFSPDSSTLAGSEGNRIRLWDSVSGAPKTTLTGHTDDITSVAFSPDGRTLASGSEDRTVRLWDVTTGAAKGTLGGHTDDITSVAFSPDGRTLASSSRDHTGRLWDAISGHHKTTLTGHTGVVRSVAFSPDGKTIATGSWDKTVRLWDAHSGQHQRILIEHTKGVHQIAFSPDGKTIAIGTAHLTNEEFSEIGLWNATTGEYQIGKKGFWNALDFAFGPDGQTIATPTKDRKQLMLWDAVTGVVKKTFPGGSSFAFSPDGQTFATGTGDGFVYLSELTPDILQPSGGTSTLLPPLPAYPPQVRIIHFYPNDHPLQPNMDTEIEKLVKETQNFYAEQMENHGFGRKTFQFETDSDGKAVVHHLQGGRPAEDYTSQSVRVLNELANLLDLTDHVHLVVLDPSLQGALSVCGIARLQGLAYTPTPDRAPQLDNYGSLAVVYIAGHCANVRVTAHELGHTFGLSHDARDRHYVMYPGNVQETPRLSYAAAEWLNVYPFFNASPSNPNTENYTTIKMLPQRADQLRFQIVDKDGLHQAQLILTGQTAYNICGNKESLHHFQALNGTSGITLFFPSTETSTQAELRVIDRQGNVSWSSFLIEPDSSVQTVETDVNGDGTVNIQDLVLVASNFGATGENAADVNGDGTVNIQDLVQVAAQLGTGDAASPAWEENLIDAFTRAEVELWLRQAQQLNLTDATSQRGIGFLAQLLLVLTPKETALLPNYPNPFNPETWIPYQLATPADVTLHIHAVDGSLVRMLSLGHKPVGIYQSRSRAAYWDGRNQLGEPVASGVYFYTLTAGDFTATRKMLIRK